MKKLKVNTEGCIGCGACVGLDPEHFDFNEEGLSVVVSEENIDPEKIQEIIEACPVSVISYEEVQESPEMQTIQGEISSSPEEMEHHCDHCDHCESKETEEEKKKQECCGCHHCEEDQEDEEKAA